MKVVKLYGQPVNKATLDSLARARVALNNAHARKTTSSNLKQGGTIDAKK